MRKEKLKIGLACAGGAIEGAAYEIGALCALDEVLEGVDFNDLDIYVGVSAGAFINACLANKITPAQLAKAIMNETDGVLPITPEHFFTPALDEYKKRLLKLPGVTWSAIWNYIRNPLDLSLAGSIYNFLGLLPNGLFSNANMEKYLRANFATEGRSNTFGDLKATLRIVATNLDTGEAVRFGEYPYQDVPISKAVQASTALPLFYKPVEMKGTYFIDGVARRTVHASAALKSGADLVFCINPIMPFNAQKQRQAEQWVNQSLAEKGLPTVLSQTFRLMISSRMRTGFRNYTYSHPEADFVLIEPSPGNYRMFFTNIFSFTRRREVCEMAYEDTRAYLRNNLDAISEKLLNYSITVNHANLFDSSQKLFKSDWTKGEPAGNKSVLAETDEVLERLEALLKGYEKTTVNA